MFPVSRYQALTSVRRAVARALDKVGAKDALKARAILLLDRLGVAHELAPTQPHVRAQRIMARSRHTLASLPAIESGERVLFMSGRTMIDKFPIWNEALLAWGLRLRGAEPQIVLCDEALTACEVDMVSMYPDREAYVASSRPVACDLCFRPTEACFRAFQWPVRHYREFIDPEVWDRAKDLVARTHPSDYLAFEHLGVHVGEQVQATAHRSLLCAELDLEDPLVEATIRRFLINGIIMTEISRAVLDALRPDITVAHHGIYLTGGIFTEYARRHGTRVIIWAPAGYRHNAVIFQHGQTYHHFATQEPDALWADRALTSKEREAMQSYLDSRATGSADDISYVRDGNADLDYIRSALDLQLDPPVVAMFTNIPWDARVFYPEAVFSDFTEWLVSTIQHFTGRPDIQLVVRLHPAEVKHHLGRARDRADDIVRRYLPDLPRHIKIVPPESNLSSYGLLKLASAVIVYGGTLGLESAVRGLPVVVAGDAWYRGKGFTIDPENPTEYFDLLSQIGHLPGLNAEQVERALQFAYHLFFRRFIPFPAFYHHRDLPVIHTLDDLKPGRNQAVDVICDGILHGTPFLYEEKEFKRSLLEGD